MAIVKREKVYIGQRTALEFMKVTKFDPADGMFSIKLPDYMVKALGKQAVQGLTLAQVNNEWMKAEALFISAGQKKRKVILFDIHVNEKESNRQDMSFTSGIAVGVFAIVCEETVTELPGGKRTFQYEWKPSGLPQNLQNGQGNGPSIRSRNDAWPTLIEWTEEREAFFCKIGLAMGAIIGELRKLEDSKVAEQIADSGAKLLSQ